MAETFFRAKSFVKAESEDDLSFSEGDLIKVTKQENDKAFGVLENGISGWFKLSEAEPTAKPSTALDAFILEAQAKGAPAGGPKKIAAINKQLSLINFLKERPMTEQPVDPATIQTTLTPDELALAKKNLAKSQKKKKKSKTELFMQNIKQNIFPSNDPDLTEEQVDQIVIKILLAIPVSRQKHIFSHYDDVFTGATLIQHLKTNLPSTINKYESNLTQEAINSIAALLIEKNIIYNVADPAKNNFKAKYLYQLTSSVHGYGVLNLDKICFKPSAPVNGYELSIKLVAQMIIVMKTYLPNYENVKKSPEMKEIGLFLAELQVVSLKELNDLQKLIFRINLYNTLVLYLHAKYSPPLTTAERKFLYENCSVFTDGKVISIQDLENVILESVSIENFLLYFCLGDCTKSSPATFIFSTDNYEMTKIYSVRHYLNRALIFDSNNYEIQFPKIFQRIAKDLKVDNEGLVTLFKPYLNRERREDLDKINEINANIEVKFQSLQMEPFYSFEEASPLSPR